MALKEPILLHVSTKKGKVRIERVHLEEDTGKLQHRKVNSKNVTLIDFNRSGVPLVEIVTKPDIHSGVQAKEYTQKLQNIIRFLEINLKLFVFFNHIHSTTQYQSRIQERA